MVLELGARVLRVKRQPATLTGDVTIVADPSGNSLMVRSNRADLALIEAAVQQLDVRPLQAGFTGPPAA